MNPVLDNVSAAAGWLGPCAWILLGACMTVSAILDPALRRGCAAFAAVAFLRAALDAAHGSMSQLPDEFAQSAWCGAFTGVLLVLLGQAPRAGVAAAGGVFLFGVAVGIVGGSACAALASFSLAFGVASVAFARRRRETGGYAPTALCAYCAALSLAAAARLVAGGMGDLRVTTLASANPAFLDAVAVLLGWVHLPRELRGRTPVRVERPQRILHFVGILSGEAAVVLGLLAWFAWPPVLALVGMTLLVLTGSMLFFHHRHLLVLHTDRVTLLLDQRTASLSEAQAELAHRNAIQARQLEEQARDLASKAEVIERHRRLELAAQTAGQAAHDIQNLITPALAQVTQLQQLAEEAPAVRPAADRLRARLEDMLELNSQLLALARRGRLDFHPVSLLELARETLANFPAGSTTLEDADESWVQGSWSQLSRALANLARNALEAAPRRNDRIVVRLGIVKVPETRRCHLGFLSPGRYATLEVEDTGPGIPGEIRERIFEPFFSSKADARASGSGLGLAIVNAVAEDHRGVLDLRTGPEGTCFTLYLPAIDTPAPAAEPASLHGNETVLFADDDPTILDRYGRLLEEAGYQVIHAEDGREAFHVLQGGRVDLLILDLKMPHLTGLEVFFGALQEHPGVRAIVHSSYVSSEEALQLRALGVAALLSKPAAPGEFLATVRTVLDAHPSPLPRGAVSN